jgi:hypothetical protein
MARLQVADGGNGLQIWMVAANISNKQSRTADSGWFPAWRLGVGLTTPHSKIICLLRKFTRSLGHGLILWIMENYNIQNYNFACGSVWARNLVSNIKGGT